MHAALVRQTPSSEILAQVDSLAGLAAILESEQSLCYLPRSLDDALQSEALTALRQRLSVSCSLHVPADPAGWEEVMRTVEPLRAYPALRTDIALLLDVFATLLEPDAIGLRIQSLEQPMCPRLHVDRVAIRLLCTYLGAGSQWLADAHVDRGLLGTAGVDEWCASPHLYTLPVGAIALLKGESFPGHAGRGLIHRSPPTPQPRLLLSLDALWR